MSRDPIGEMSFRLNYPTPGHSGKRRLRSLARLIMSGNTFPIGLAYVFVENAPIHKYDYMGLANPVCQLDKPEKRCFWWVKGCDMNHAVVRLCCKKHEACHIFQYKKLVKQGTCPACEYNPKTCSCKTTPGNMSVERDCQGVKNKDMECPCYWIQLKCLVDGAQRRGADWYTKRWMNIVWEMMWKKNCFGRDDSWIEPF